MKEEFPTESGRTTGQPKQKQYSESLNRLSKVAEKSILRGLREGRKKDEEGKKKP